MSNDNMKRYKDFYGCTASIKEVGTEFVLTMRTAGGKLISKKAYSSERGAKCAMSKSSDGWNEIKGCAI